MHAQVLVDDRTDVAHVADTKVRPTQPSNRINTIPNLALVIVILIAIFGAQSSVFWVIAITVIGVHTWGRTRSRLRDLNELLETW